MINLLDGWFKFNVGEGAFYAAFGFVFVFAGIAVLVGLFTLLGFAMKKINGVRAKKEKAKAAAKEKPAPEAVAEEGIPPEVVVAITAALAVCMAQEKQSCGFVVRRIKKL